MVFIPKEVVNFIESQWGKIADLSTTDWDYLTRLALCDKKNVCEKIRQFSYCIRLVGQSGAGKTTQLLPAVQEMLKEERIDFIRLAVRDFVKYHPQLAEIEQRYGSVFLREKTNAWALFLLTCVLVACIEEHLPVLLEVTVLSPIYEKFIQALFLQKGYFCDYHCLAIDRSISDAWIAERRKQTGRVVEKQSSDFFFQTIDPAFQYLQTLPLKGRIFLWDGVHCVPQQFDFCDKNFLTALKKERVSSEMFLSATESLEAKKQFMKRFYHGFANT